jgi:hypothetical protein
MGVLPKGDMPASDILIAQLPPPAERPKIG